MSINQFIAGLSPRQIRFIRTVLGLFSCFTILLDYLHPKDNRTIVFGSDTGEFISGSPKALFEHIKKRHPEYKVSYYLPFNRSLSMSQRVKYILRFAPVFLRAKFLVSSHPPSDFYPFSWSARKVFINTWHGSPLKSIFFADRGDTKSNLRGICHLSKKISAFIVSSKLEAAMCAECFLIDPRKFRYLGQPRNDILLKYTESTDKEILKQMIGKIPEYDKAILYCPTYRRHNATRLFPFADFDLKHLNRFLEENRLIILMRGHVYDKGLEKQYLSERIVDFAFDVCNDINSALPDVDILVTDYSSAYIDFLLLDRPCIFIPYDLEEYKAKRGLLYDDYDFWAPGYKVSTYKGFISAIEEILSGRDLYKTKRQEINRQLNYHQIENSCERVFELIQNWGKEEHP
jgi:CDP-glycerol glycerophosphotransferase (TagB/SpsB family)